MTCTESRWDRPRLWKDAVVYAFKRGYRVSEDGRLYNPKGKELTISTSSKYPVFGLYFEGRIVGIPIHKFAAYCFFGDSILKAPCVRHINGNTYDVSKNNIDYGTYSQNEFDKSEETRKNSTSIAVAATRHTIQYKKRHKGLSLDLKVCSECKLPKLKTLFGPSKYSADKLNYRCRKCLAERERRRRNGV